MKARRALVVLAALVVALALAPVTRADFGFTGTTTAAGVTLGGDVIGPANANSATKINGSSVVAGGALTTGNVLQVNGAASTTYAAVNLAGGAAYVTGVLPAGNQSLEACGGDMSGTAGSCVVAKVSGSTPIVWTPNELQYVTGAVPLFDQATESATTKASDWTWKPQQSTHTTDQGGGNAIVTLQAPAGAGVEAGLQVFRGAAISAQLGPLLTAGTNGALWLGQTTPSSTNYTLAGVPNNVTTLNSSGSQGVNIASAGTSRANFASGGIQLSPPLGGTTGSNAFAWLSVSVALTSGTGNVLTNAQYYAPHIKFTGTLTGAGTTVTLPATDGACWDLDFSAIVTIADSIGLIANGNTWSVAVASVGTEYPHVCYSSGAGKLVGVSMIQ